MEKKIKSMRSSKLRTDQLTDLEPSARVALVRRYAPPVCSMLTHVPRSARRQRESPRLVARPPRQRWPHLLGVQLPPGLGGDHDYH